MQRFTKPISFLLKLSLTLGAFWYVFSELDTEHLFQILKNQDRFQIGQVLALMFLQVLAGALRWRRVVLGLETPETGTIKLTRLSALRLNYISVFFGSCLPGGAMSSDVIRVWLAKAHHIPLTLAIHSVVIDRIIALLGLAFLVIFGLPSLGHMLGFDVIPVFIATFVVVVLSIVFVFYAEHLLGRFSHIALVRWLLHFLSGVKMLLMRPLTVMRLGGYAMIGHLTYCASAYVLAQSMGISLSLWEAAVLIPPVILMITLPLSVGGWGLREVGMVGMLGLIGVSKTAALALSVQLGILAIITSLPGGILWLIARKKEQGAKHGHA